MGTTQTSGGRSVPTSKMKDSVVPSSPLPPASEVESARLVPSRPLVVDHGVDPVLEASPEASSSSST